MPENFDKNRNLNNSQPEICVNTATCCREKGVACFYSSNKQFTSVLSGVDDYSPTTSQHNNQGEKEFPSRDGIISSHHSLAFLPRLESF